MDIEFWTPWGTLLKLGLQVLKYCFQKLKAILWKSENNNEVQNLKSYQL